MEVPVAYGRYSSWSGVQTCMAPGQGCGPLPLPPLVYVGKVASDSELPSSPRIGWTFVAEAPGVYAGHFLNEGDAIVCIGMAPAEWTALAGPIDHSIFVKFSDIDPALDSSSSNPVENRAIVSELDLKADAADIMTISNIEILHIVTGG